MALPKIKPEKPLFEHFPKVFKKKGRVGAFEDLRDTLLANWETMMSKGMNAYSVIKLVIETDRHAMFAEVQQDKKRQQFDQNVWAEFQDYLHGGVGSDEQVQPGSQPEGAPALVDRATLDTLTSEYEEKFDEEGADSDGEEEN